MWRLSIEDDQGEKTSVNLVRDEYTIGRAEHNSVRLTERNISRRHAKLVKENHHWLLSDLASYNGAYVNGARVVDPVPLAHGDLVQLGDYRLEILDDAVAGNRAHPTVRDGIAATGRRDTLVNQPDRFVMVVGPTPGAEFPLTEPRMIVGRGEECDISINHASVSRVHAEVHDLGEGRYELIDKGSANGVRVNGVELQRALIDGRDNIELGDVILKFVRAGDIYVPGAEESHQLPPGSLAANAMASNGERASASSGLPMGIKVGMGVVALGALVLLGMLALGEDAPSSPPTVSAEDQPDPSPADRVMDEARALFEKGDVYAAHAKLLELPQGSESRRTPLFRDIEGEWANAMIQAAEEESDVSAKRALLNQIATSPTVDAGRRNRALKLLEVLPKEGVEIDELPETHPSAAPEAPSAGAGNQVATAPPKAAKTPKLARPAGATPPGAKRAPKPPKPAPQPAPSPKAPTLVRDDPFGSD